MYSFIVLGIIPGTDIQITFNIWLLATASLAIALCVRRLLRQRHPILHARLVVAFYAMSLRQLPV